MKKGKKELKGINPKKTSEGRVLHQLRLQFGQESVRQYLKRGVFRAERERLGLCL